MGIDGFGKVTVAEKIGNGLLSLIQSSGLVSRHWRLLMLLERPSWFPWPGCTGANLGHPGVAKPLERSSRLDCGVCGYFEKHQNTGQGRAHHPR